MSKTKCEQDYSYLTLDREGRRRLLGLISFQSFVQASLFKQKIWFWFLQFLLKIGQKVNLPSALARLLICYANFWTVYSSVWRDDS